MSPVPNRRDDEVRRLLDTPHPMVPVELPGRAIVRGQRILRRRRVVRRALWALVVAAVVAGIVYAVLAWSHHTTTVPPADGGNGDWWSPMGLRQPTAAAPFSTVA